MNLLWAPWRGEYVRAEKSGGCFLCEAAGAATLRDRLVLARTGRTLTILNAFPYNPGHLMVAPIRHLARLDTLDEEERLELMAGAATAVRALERAFRPDGFNLGLNLGRVAGAGLEDHLHVHVVPRWGGDTNFMPVLADVKVLPQHLLETQRTLSDAWRAMRVESSAAEN